MLTITLALSNKSYLLTIFLHSDSVLHPCPLPAFPYPTPSKGETLLLGASLAERLPLGHGPWTSKLSAGNSSKDAFSGSASWKGLALLASWLVICVSYSSTSQHSSLQLSGALGNEAKQMGQRILGRGWVGSTRSQSPQLDNCSGGASRRPAVPLGEKEVMGTGLPISKGATGEAFLSLPSQWHIWGHRLPALVLSNLHFGGRSCEG